MKPIPPYFTLKFLRWFCREDYLDEVEGDLIEIYEKQLIDSPAKAKWKFTWLVITHFRPDFIKAFNISQNSNTTAMIRHNLLLSIRNFKRYKGSFLINSIGLSTGLACALTIFLWVQDELKKDKFHANDKQLYQVLEHVNQGTGMITRQTTVGPMAKALANEMPEVQYAVTTTYEEKQTISIDRENYADAYGMHVSPDFFKLFSHELIHGKPEQVLIDKNSVVISESLAKQFFGSTEAAIGQHMTWQQHVDIKVSGVFKDIDKNSSSQFDFLLSFEKFWEANEWVQNWFNTMPRTYVLLYEGTNVNELNAKLKNIIKVKTDNQATHRSPFLTKYSDRYLYGEYENTVQSGGRIEYVNLFSIIAVFVLLIACINFMNLSTAKASRRLKEVGVKKAIGVNRKTLIFQYLSESITLSSIAMLIGLVLATLLLPQFNSITEKQLSLNFSFDLILGLISIVLFTGFLAGSYPALYLSGFDTATILKGKLNRATGELWTRKGLVVFQFTLSVVLIVSVLVVYKQIAFTHNKHLGYNKENIILIEEEGSISPANEALTNELNKIEGVIGAAGIEHNMAGANGGTYSVNWPGKDTEDRTEFTRTAVGYDMIELLEVEFEDGRPFSREHAADSFAIIFNQAAIDYMNIEDPVGKTVKLWGNERQIIGVVKNFHYQSFREEIKPLFFYLAPHRANYYMVKLETQNQDKALNNLQEFYQSHNPGFLFDYQFLDQEYEKQYRAEQRLSVISKYFAGITILISCLGLFGLAAFTAERRLKEIGIRKILGAGALKIITVLSKDFTLMVLTSLLISLPLSYFIAVRWLDGFAFSVDLNLWWFAFAGFSALIIAWITVGYQTLKAANVNPIECLKDE